MVQVKEFLNYSNNLDSVVNQWLEENKDIEIIDIKYSVSSMMEELRYSQVSKEFSGVLIVYKTK